MSDSAADADLPDDATRGGEHPGESLRELTHPEERVGATDEETARQQANVDAAAAEAERLRHEPGHHGRDHL